MAGVTFCDELVKEYLVFRGFLTTLKAFDNEVKNDKDKAFRPDKVVEHLTTCINSLDFDALRESWNHFDQRVFCRLERSFLNDAKKLENALFRMYLATCLSMGRHDKIFDFFEKMTQELQGQPEWKDWFALPFIKNPEENPIFAVYFTRQWQDTMLLSLHNFTSVVFQSMATPTLLSYEEELIRLNALQEENEMLKSKLASLRISETELPKCAFDSEPQEIPTPAELMDDFFIIAQEAPNEKEKTSIKNLIRNISSGLPTSPILGRRQEVKKQDDSLSPGSSRINKMKSRSSNVPPQSSNTLTVEISRVKSESEVSVSASSVREDTGSRLPDPRASPNVKRSPIARNIPSVSESKEGFFILSQETYSEHHSFITHCKFNNSGSVVASADMDGVIKIWNASPSPNTLSTIMSKSSVLALEWGSKRDRLLFHGGGGGTSSCVRLYDIKERKTVGEVFVDSNSPSNHKILCITSSPTEANFVTSSNLVSGNLSNGHLCLWDTRTLQLQHHLQLPTKSSYAHCCAFNHNGQLLLVGVSDGSTCIYDLRSAESIATWMSHTSKVFAAQFSADETTCYTMGGDGKFIQWSINKTGCQIGELTIHSGATGPFNNASGSQQLNPVGKLFSFSNDENHVLTCGPVGGMIYRMNRHKLKHVLGIGGHNFPVSTVDWCTAMECSTCLCGSVDGKITVSTLLTQ